MSKKVKNILIISTLIITVIIYKKYLSGIDADYLRTWISGFGALAPLAYILVFTILPIAFFPVPVLALAGGLAFGLVGGTVYTIVGAYLNSAVMFVMAKVMARDTVVSFLEKKLPEKWYNKLMNADSKKSFMTVFILRLIPAVPYNVINYASGLSGMSFKNYIIATMLGIIPGTVVFINIGDKATDITDPKFIISIMCLVALTVVSVILAKRVNRESDESGEISNEQI